MSGAGDQCAPHIPRKRGKGSRALCPFSTALVTFALATSGAAAEAPRHPGGFWKCKTDNKVASPEFDGEDPVGLASGKHIPTDCAIHWSDGRGKTYCFASLPSLNFFDAEIGLRDKAQAFWEKEHGTRGR